MRELIEARNRSDRNWRAGRRPESCWRTWRAPVPKSSIASSTTSRLCSHVAQPGDFHGRVRACRQARHGAAPAAELVDVGQAGVIQHDGGVREIGREARRLLELAPRRLQLEVQPERREARIALPPFRVAHHPGLGLVADAAHERVPRLRLQDCAQSRGQPGLRNRDRGETAWLSNLGDEVHFAQRIARIPFRFDVDAALDAPARGVGAVVGDQIRLSQGAVVPVAERDRLRVAQPRVVMRLRVPDVEVRVSYCESMVRSRLQSWRRRSAGARDRGRSGCSRAPSRARRDRRAPPSARRRRGS